MRECVAKGDPIVTVSTGNYSRYGDFVAPPTACYVARCPDDCGLEGIGGTQERAIADMREIHADFSKRARESPEDCFARRLAELLAAAKRTSWRVTRQQATFDGETGGEVEIRLRFDLDHARRRW